MNDTKDSMEYYNQMTIEDINTDNILAIIDRSFDDTLRADKPAEEALQMYRENPESTSISHYLSQGIAMSQSKFETVMRAKAPEVLELMEEALESQQKLESYVMDSLCSFQSAAFKLHFVLESSLKLLCEDILFYSEDVEDLLVFFQDEEDIGRIMLDIIRTFHDLFREKQEMA